MSYYKVEVTKWNGDFVHSEYITHEGMATMRIAPFVDEENSVPKPTDPVDVVKMLAAATYDAAAKHGNDGRLTAMAKRAAEDAAIYAERSITAPA